MQKDRKKIHKKIVKDIRRLNKSLAKDEYLGINRFRIDLYHEDWHRFDDGSGGRLYVIFKLTDNLTGNKALFDSTNYGYIYDLNRYANDFLIRCSSGHEGHYPPLSYIAYDVHDIVEYAGNGNNHSKEECSKVIGQYNVEYYNF